MLCTQIDAWWESVSNSPMWKMLKDGIECYGDSDFPTLGTAFVKAK